QDDGEGEGRGRDDERASGHGRGTPVPVRVVVRGEVAPIVPAPVPGVKPAVSGQSPGPQRPPGGGELARSQATGSPQGLVIGDRRGPRSARRPGGGPGSPPPPGDRPGPPPRPARSGGRG